MLGITGANLVIGEIFINFYEIININKNLIINQLNNYGAPPCYQGTITKNGNQSQNLKGNLYFEITNV